MSAGADKDCQDWLMAVARARADAQGAGGFEDAARAFTGLARARLGDHTAAQRPGALLAGERDYRVSGVFLISPDQAYNVLVASDGFPPEQRRLSIPIGWNHPGEVVRSHAPLLLENTDDHTEFRQFLKTSRMGSSVYAPILTPDGMVGQIVAAAQARWTYGPKDLKRLQLLAAEAAQIWSDLGAADWWAADYPAPDAWYADKMGVADHA